MFGDTYREAMIPANVTYIDLIYFFFLSLTIIVVIYIILMNLFLIIGILTDHYMRGRLFFKLILLIAVAHFLQGVLVIPLHIEIGFDGGMWTHDPDICTFWHLTDLTLNTVLVLLFLMLMLERFFCLTYPQMVMSKCLGLLMLLSPWLLSTSFVVFLYFALPPDTVRIIINATEGTETKDTCTIGYYVKGVYSFFGFLCPAAYVFGFCWANAVILCLLRRRHAERMFESNLRCNTAAGSLVALCFVMMWFPVNSGILLPAEFYNKVVNFTGAVYLGFANAALTPTLWIILPAIKRGFGRICCCCCTSNCGTSDHHGSVVTSSVEEPLIRMLGQERVQPSTTTKL